MTLMKFTTTEPDRKMKIKIKDLNAASMEITDKGLELSFHENDARRTHTGDLIITPTKLIWNKGRTSKTGQSINWPEFFKLMKKQN